MCKDESENEGWLQKTRWDWVARAAAGDTEAIGELYSRYRAPLIGYLIGKFRFNQHDAEDIFADFFNRKIFEGRLPAQANPVKGKFRSLLITALRNFAFDRIRKERKLSHLEDSELEKFTKEPTQEEVADDALRLAIDCALHLTRNHFEAKGKQLYWELFKGRIVDPMLDDVAPVPFPQFIRPDGFPSPQQAFNALASVKRTFKKYLEECREQFEI